MIIIGLIVLSIIFIVVSTVRFKLHPFLSLLVAAFLFGLFSGMPLDKIIQSINEGFGGTIGNIGIIIIAGIIIGTFMENSGGAYALADKILQLIGRKRVHVAMALIGYVVSIPVFSDSGFIILTPLNKALTKRAGLSLAGTATALALGLMCTHTMVPPTPGPIAAAGILHADLGMVIMVGLGVSFIALIVTTVFARYFASKVDIDPNPELNEAQITDKMKEAPSALKSYLPIAVPIVLIVLRSVGEMPSHPFGTGPLKSVIGFVGNPMVALFIGMGLALLLPKKLEKSMLSVNGWVGKGLKDAAIIILITGAGGAFGKILQNSGIVDLLGGVVKGSSLGLWLPFLVAAMIRTAQGSATVAMITAASIISPLLSPMSMDSEISKAMVVVAIGAGSNVVSHVNDSFFWVTTQMSNMKVGLGYRLISVGTGILGLTAMIILTVMNLFVG